MRISDWSSDVCSSDLAEVEHIITDSGSTLVVTAPEFEPLMALVTAALPHIRHWYTTGPGNETFVSIQSLIDSVDPLAVAADAPIGSDMPYSSGRSDEQTSELQPPMSISYAFFCLKK